MSSTLAILLGVIIGFPIALWINEVQQKVIEHSEKEKTEEETNSKTRKTISLISDELKSSHIILSDHKLENLYKLKTVAMSALADGGELQWIGDISLLKAESMTYYSIKTVIYSLDLTSGGKLFNWLMEIIYLTLSQKNDIFENNIQVRV